jgi:hypothetical protein
MSTIATTNNPAKNLFVDVPDVNLPKPLADCSSKFILKIFYFKYMDSYLLVKSKLLIENLLNISLSSLLKESLPRFGGEYPGGRWLVSL